MFKKVSYKIPNLLAKEAPKNKTLSYIILVNRTNKFNYP